MNQEFKDKTASNLSLLSYFLLACIMASYSARLDWFADLFSHFHLQYTIGALVFLLASLLINRTYLIVMNSVLLVLCLTELLLIPSIRLEVNNDLKPTIKITQFNKLGGNKNYDEIEEWVRKTKPDFIVFQEADRGLHYRLETLKDLYPFKVDNSAPNTARMLIISKYKFAQQENFVIPKGSQKNLGFKLKFTPKGFSSPITLMTFHASTPLSKRKWIQRNNQLKYMAKRTGEIEEENIILMGDWNVTPYSPYFKDILTTSGLLMASNSSFPMPTWPALFLPQITQAIQIPIDHILFSNNLSPISQSLGPSLGSDHHSITMEFIER